MMVVCLAVLCAGGASAQDAGLPDSCDPNFHEVIKARAWMEGKREMEVAQTLILKPDSVLEYSCFDDRLNELAVAADSMFSDNVFSDDLFKSGATGYEFGPNPPPNPPRKLFQNNLDLAMSDFVYNVMFEFLLQNFSHIYLGGTYAGLGGGGGACNPMQVVWDFARCSNFDDRDFFTLNELIRFDPRQHPVPCNDPNRTTNWTNNTLDAFRPAGAPGAVESVVTHLDLLSPNQCGAIAPIRTGARVFRANSGPEGEFDDAVCLAPGCDYTGEVCE